MKVRCRGFNGQYSRLNGEQDIDINICSLLWASMTVGAPSYRSAFPTSWHALSFTLHKMFAISSVVDINNGNVTLPQNYEYLDPSEKTMLSYWMGMTMTKLVADNLMNIPLLAHVHSLYKSGVITNDKSGSKSLPDLVGQDIERRWHVFEAKCRKEPVSKNERNDWKKQASHVQTVDGVPPATKNYCLTLQKPKFIVDLVDPNENPEFNYINLKIDPLTFQKFYYQPFFEIFRKYESENARIDTDIIYKSISSNFYNGKKCSIGILKDVFEQVENLMENDMFIDTSSLVKSYRQNQNFDEIRHSNKYIGTDGIIVRLE